MTMSLNKKTFVLDTNVILHDSTSIYHFKEHDIVLPITVIEELDGFKKGKEIINCNAREFLRSLDALTEDKLFNGGIPIGDLPRVFSRSYRADNPIIEGVGDSGVGLSIAKTLVEAHNGRIWVDTESGQGSTFSVLIPLLNGNSGELGL